MLELIRMLKKIIYATFAVLLLLVFFLPIKDTDFGWHYRCGEEFLKSGKLCLTNEFSYFLPNYHWANPNSLYDISLALIFDAFGFWGVSVFGSLIFTAIFLILLKLLNGDWWVKTFALIAMVLLSQNVFSLGYRSQILGLLFLVLEFAILKGPTFERSDLEKVGPFKMPLGRLFSLGLLFILWANTHPSFFLGPLISAFYTIEKIVCVYLDKNNHVQSKTRRLIFHGVFFLIPSLATLVNPFGSQIYQEVWQHFQSPLNQMIAEWTVPDLWQILLITISSLTIIYLALINKIKADYRLILLLVFAYFAILARRNLPLYYIIAFWLVSEVDLSPFLTDRISRLLNYLSFGILTIGAILFIPQIKQTIAFDTNHDLYCNNSLVKLPCQAIEKLKGKTGNLFNMYEQGGFLIWKLPQMKIFADGRMPAWKDENNRSPYQVYLSIVQTQPGWNEELKKYGTNYLLVNNGTFLDLLLQEKGANNFGWEEEYRDQLSVIYRRFVSDDY